MPTRNVNLTESFDDFITKEIEAGRYRNASEVMRAGLRLLQQQTAEDGAKLAALRRLAKTGLDQLDQGRGVEFTTSKELAKHLDGLGGPKPVGSARRRP
jgi:antitoxin ParD1/3/4